MKPKKKIIFCYFVKTLFLPGTPEREAMKDELDEMLVAPPPPPEPEAEPEPVVKEEPEYKPVVQQRADFFAKPSAVPAAPYGAWVRITKEEKS